MVDGILDARARLVDLEDIQSRLTASDWRFRNSMQKREANGWKTWVGPWLLTASS
jgi:hypothetical protein